VPGTTTTPLQVHFKGKVDRRGTRTCRRRGPRRFFEAVPAIHRPPADAFVRRRLGYVRRPAATTLSGGEAQRVKLPRNCNGAPPAAPSTFSTSPLRDCTSRTSASCSASSPSWWRRATRSCHRAQPRRHQDRRLDHRLGPRAVAAAAPSWRPAARGRARQRQELHRQSQAAAESVDAAFLPDLSGKHTRSRGVERVDRARMY